MTTSRTIHDYLDGMLPADAEEHLFVTLATDAEARRELKGQISLHTAVRKDMAMVAVPDDTTAAIYADLGFALPVAGAASVPAASSVVTSIPSSMMPWLLRIGAVVLALWIGIEWRDMVPAGRTPSVSADDAGRSWTEAPLRTSVSPERHDAEHGRVRSDVADDPEGTVASSSSMTSRRSVAQHVQADGYGRRYDDRKEAHSQKLVPPVVDAGTDDRDVRIMNVPRYRQGAFRATPYDADALRRDALASIPPASDVTEWTVDVQARALSTLLSTPSGGLPNSVQGALQDFAIGAWVTFDDEQDLGVEVGRQAFPQEFTRRVGNQDLQYRQTPELFWVGPSYRRQFRDWSIGGVVTPVGQTMIGWTQTGPTARAMMGFAITPERRLSMTLGVEGAWLWYPVQGHFYTTSTIGISYGLHYRF